MTINDHISTFAGRPVVLLTDNGALDRLGEIALKLDVDYEAAEDGTTITERFAVLASAAGLEELKALVIGSWGEMWDNDVGPVLQGLIALRSRLSGLRALFVAEMICEECEVSWIQLGDVSPLWEAFPQLEELRIRGSNGLSLGRVRHTTLKKLVLESGGLPAEVVRQAIAADLPQLEHLELWLGTEEYGGDATVEDLAPLLSGEKFPNLKYLGLRNATISDEIATALATAPVLERIERLDLSLGTLGDEGARALLNCGRLGHLRELDLHHHYISEEVADQLAELPCEPDLSDREEPDDWGDGELHRYTSVAE